MKQNDAEMARGLRSYIRDISHLVIHMLSQANGLKADKGALSLPANTGE